MTDREKVETLFNELGLEYDTQQVTLFTEPDAEGKYDSVFHLELEAGVGDKVEGYSGFMCTWAFDEEGNFLQVGIWE